MKFKDLSQQKEFTKFIPNTLIEDRDIPVNKKQDNWLEDWACRNSINTIIKLPEDFIFVVYNQEDDEMHPSTALYRGILE